MAKKKLVLVREVYDGWPAGTYNPYLAFEDAVGGCVKLIDANPKLSLKNLVKYCDNEAKGDNYHNFVGISEALAKILKDFIEVEQATAIMHEIALRGGLHRIDE
jgi:hypothetical protein